MTTYNSTLETYNEQPTQEAIKAAEMISRYAYWIAIVYHKFVDTFIIP